MQFKSADRPLKFRWFFMFSVQKDWARMWPMVRQVSIVAIRPYAFPPQGAQWTKKYYKGFWIRFNFFWPFELESWR